MANMSYSRFENTYSDMVDCVTALEDVVYNEGQISQREWDYAKRMLRWCETFISTIEDAEEGEIRIIN